ncbi:MAG: Hsp20/alpha crystallin family protein [Candidatus Omnitrophica bacterium]|nr:Hsp20/alpha crystallin family protein [Candidatus Omnitrophota bacterium]
MKKIFVTIVLLSAIAVMPAYGQVQSSGEDEYIDLKKLRQKIVRMKQEVDKLVKDITATAPVIGEEFVAGFQDVRVDVTETDKTVVVKADLPGMDKDKIDISLERGKILTISGSREMYTEKKAPGVIRQERMTGKFQRVIELPVECMNEGIKASYNSGVLDIEIPKKKEAKRETVKIKVQ